MNQKVFKRRVYITGLLILALSILFIINLFTLHFSNKIIVPDENIREVHRGYIKDSNGFILAISIELNSLFANPEEIDDPNNISKKLSPIIGLSQKYILKKLMKKKRFIWIKRKLDDSIADKVKSLKIKGLYFKKEYRRVYPHGTLASNIVGFVGIDNSGLGGIEYKYNSLLSGLDDGVSRGSMIFGKNIVLTIDRYIQHISEKEIENTVRNNQAKQGVVLVLEVKTGRILALAKYPNFNPNYYYRYSQFARRNYSIIDSFEPGSTFKVLSLASMLEFNLPVLSSSYTCDGKIDIADVTINCTHVHGTIKMDDVIRHSCNVGVIKAMKGLGKKKLYHILRRFQFGKKTGIVLAGETAGIFREPGKWSGLSKYSIAIGHEISVTSLQLAAAYGAIGNGGVYVLPSIIESIEDHDGSIVKKFKPKIKGRVIKKYTAHVLKKMMRGVVESGTGILAEPVYCKAAGKTGTSNKYIRKKGYSDRVVSSFIGLAPFKRPEICVLVIVDEPINMLSGGKVAAPVFSKIVDRVLVKKGIINKRIRAESPVPVRIRKVKFTGKKMPDFTGKRLPESVKLLLGIKRKYMIQYSIAGSGKVVRQNPAPGTKLKNNDKIILNFEK